jgi:hypothetical protein
VETHAKRKDIPVPRDYVHAMRCASPICIFLAVTATECRPRAGRPNTSDAEVVCVHVGQSCEFSPDKLGTCVRRDDCAAEPCLVCQSQH